MKKTVVCSFLQEEDMLEDVRTKIREMEEEADKLRQLQSDTEKPSRANLSSLGGELERLISHFCLRIEYYIESLIDWLIVRFMIAEMKPRSISNSFHLVFCRGSFHRNGGREVGGRFAVRLRGPGGVQLHDRGVGRAFPQLRRHQPHHHHVRPFLRTSQRVGRKADVSFHRTIVPIIFYYAFQICVHWICHEGSRRPGGCCWTIRR